MVKAYKQEKVQEITKRLEGAKAIVLVDYKGINIQEVDDLRSRLRNNDVDYFVAKNTYIKIALNSLGITGLDDNLVGSTAVAVSLVDEVTPAREIAKFKKEVMKDKEFPTFKIANITGEIMDANELAKLALLPSKEELLAKVLSSLNAPVSNFVGVLSGVLRKFVGVVDAIAKKQTD